MSAFMQNIYSYILLHFLRFCMTYCSHDQQVIKVTIFKSTNTNYRATTHKSGYHIGAVTSRPFPNKTLFIYLYLHTSYSDQARPTTHMYRHPYSAPCHVMHGGFYNDIAHSPHCMISC